MSEDDGNGWACDCCFQSINPDGSCGCTLVEREKQKREAERLKQKREKNDAG